MFPKHPNILFNIYISPLTSWVFPGLPSLAHELLIALVVAYLVAVESVAVLFLFTAIRLVPTFLHSRDLLVDEPFTWGKHFVELCEEFTIRITLFVLSTSSIESFEIDLINHLGDFCKSKSHPEHQIRFLPLDCGMGCFPLCSWM